MFFSLASWETTGELGGRGEHDSNDSVGLRIKRTWLFFGAVALGSCLTLRSCWAEVGAGASGTRWRETSTSFRSDDSGQKGALDTRVYRPTHEERCVTCNGRRRSADGGGTEEHLSAGWPRLGFTFTPRLSQLTPPEEPLYTQRSHPHVEQQNGS